MVLGDIALNDCLCVNATVIVVDCSDGHNLYDGDIITSDLPQVIFEEKFEGTPHRHDWSKASNKAVSQYADSKVIALSVEQNCLFVAVKRANF